MLSYALKPQTLGALARAEAYYTRFALLSRELTDIDKPLPFDKIEEKAAEIEKCAKAFLAVTLENPPMDIKPNDISEIWKSFFGFPQVSNYGGGTSEDSPK